MSGTLAIITKISATISIIFMNNRDLENNEDNLRGNITQLKKRKRRTIKIKNTLFFLYFHGDLLSNASYNFVFFKY